MERAAEAARARQYRERAQRDEWACFKGTLTVCSSLEANLLLAPIVLLQLIFATLRVDGIGPVGDLSWWAVLWPTWVFNLLLLGNLMSMLAMVRWDYLYEHYGPEYEDVEAGIYLATVDELCSDSKTLARVNLGSGTLAFIIFTVLVCIKADDPAGCSWTWLEACIPLFVAMLTMMGNFCGIVRFIATQDADDNDLIFANWGRTYTLSLAALSATIGLSAHNADLLQDGEEQAYSWTMAFMPLFVQAGVTFCTPCFTGICASVTDIEIDAPPFFGTGLVNMMVMTPFVITEGLLAAKLDGKLDADVVETFIPIILATGVPSLAACTALVSILTD